MMRPLRLAWSIALVVALCGCDRSPSTRPAQPPIRAIEIYGGIEAIADLDRGVSARSVVGADLFGDFEPGMTPEAAEGRFGKPDAVVQEAGATLYVYRSGPYRRAIVKQEVLGSGGGPMREALEVRAYPSVEYVARLPKALRDFFAERLVGRVSLRTGEENDWQISFVLKEGNVAHVTATQRPR